MNGAERDESSRARLRELSLVTFAFAALTAVMTWPLVTRLPTSLPAGLGDPLLNAWTLAWGADRIAHGLQGFWTPPAFYPYPGALAYSENLLGISLLVAPVQWIGGNLVLTYNVAFLLSFVVAGVGMYLLARELTGRTDAALIAGIAYAFFPYRAAQVTHLQVLTSGWLPVALWALHRFLATTRPSMVALFAAAFLLQGLSNTYSLVFSLLPIGGLIVWALATRQCSARAIRLLAVTAVASAVILVPVVRAYRSAWQGGADLRDVVRYSANVASFLQVTAEIWYSRWLSGPGPAEGNFFPGFTVLALTAVALFAPRRQAERGESGTNRPGVTATYAAVGLLAAVLSLGPEPRAWSTSLPVVGVPYRALLAIAPGFGIVRVPARFATVFLLALSALAAFGARRILSSSSFTNRLRWAAVLGICGAIATEGYAGALRTSDFTLFRSKDERSLYTSLRYGTTAPLLELPIGRLGAGDFSRVYQAVALFHRHPIVNGMSRKATPLQDVLGSPASPFAAPETIADGVELMRGMGVGYIVIHPPLYRDSALGRATLEALRRAAGVSGSWGAPDIEVFRLTPFTEAGTSAAERVPNERIVSRTSVNAAHLGRAFDGDFNTRWSTRRPQDGTESIELTFDRPVRVARLDIVLTGAGSLSDYPRQLRVEALDDRKQPRVVYEGTTLAAVGAALKRDPERIDARLPLSGIEATTLRIRQVGTSPRGWWSIHELEVWQVRPPAD